MTIQDYLNLIPSENAQQPDFVAVVTLNVSVQVRVQELLDAMIPLFDLDTPPVGNQLDIIGEWVGVSRNVAIPIEGVFFTWDNTASVGWDSGIWATSTSQVSITSLPDQQYLLLIKAKIAANQWDGTTDGAYAIWDALFAPNHPEFAWDEIASTEFAGWNLGYWNSILSNVNILIQDYQNMSYALGIIGPTLDALTLALITGGYIPLRPEGVQVVDYFVSPGPVFAWDTVSPLLAGWDTGLWATIIAPT